MLITESSKANFTQKTVVSIFFFLDRFFLMDVDVSFQMMTVEMGVMRWAVFTLAWITSSDAPVEGVSQAIGPAMVTMIVVISVMKPKSTVPKKVSDYANL
jgi:hypothetical protein